MRKYPKTEGFWVYAHITPNGLYYIGMSKQQPRERWHPLHYKTSVLAPYIAEYGWDNIQHKVLIDGLTKNEAEQWEDRIIQALSMNGLCINKNRSGGIVRDDYKAYMKQYREDHKEEWKDYHKQYREDHKDEKQVYMKQYSKQYREDHKEEHKAYMKQYGKQRLSTAEGKIYNRVAAYNRYYPNEVIETPMEAKQKYLQWGYIPNYIKNNDLN